MDKDLNKQQFRETLEHEIARSAINERRFYMSRGEVEKLGEQAGLSKEAAVEELLHLRGDVWEGHFSASDESSWLAVHFDIPWFQRNDKLPTPLSNPN